jgi:hypothetical protein
MLRRQLRHRNLTAQACEDYLSTDNKELRGVIQGITRTSTGARLVSYVAGPVDRKAEDCQLLTAARQ